MLKATVISIAHQLPNYFIYPSCQEPFLPNGNFPQLYPSRNLQTRALLKAIAQYHKTFLKSKDGSYVPPTLEQLQPVMSNFQ